MDSCQSQMLSAPLTPVSPPMDTMDTLPRTPDQQGRVVWQRGRSPLSPESLRGLDVEVRHGGDVNESGSFELAMAQMLQDRKAYSTVENMSHLRHDSAVKKSQPKMKSPPSVVRVSRDTRKIQADIKRVVRPPVQTQSLAATHPALYTKTPQAHQRKMLPTPPPDYPKRHFRYHETAKKEPRITSPSPPWRTYTDPSRQMSGEPRFDDPKFRMLKMDLESDHPRVLSPTFMIGLPCGSMIEAANQYPDARLSHPRDAPSA